MTTATLADLINDSARVAGTVNSASVRRCKLGRILDAATQPDRAAIVTALHGDDWTDARLSQVLDRGGQRVSGALLSMHRTRSCICNPHDDQEAPE